MIRIKEGDFEYFSKIILLKETKTDVNTVIIFVKMVVVSVRDQILDIW